MEHYNGEKKRKLRSSLTLSLTLCLCTKIYILYFFTNLYLINIFYTEVGKSIDESISNTNLIFLTIM